MRTLIELDQMLEKGIQMLKDIDIPISESICPHIRLFNSHTRFGQCAGPGSKRNHSGYAYERQVSKFVVDNSEKMMMNLMLHELLHTSKDTHHHDKKWKYYAAIVNATYGYNIQRLNGDATPEDIHNLIKDKKVKKRIYEIKCPSCGATWRRKNLTKLVVFAEHYKCSKCKCNLVRIK